MWKKWIVVFAALAVGAAGVMVTSPTAVVAQPAKDKDKAAPKEKMKEPSEKQKAARATLRECAAKWKEHKKATGAKGMKAYVAFMRECRKKP